jgi:hypothetical protein
MRLIITEKPYLFDVLVPMAVERWPGEEIIMICSMPYWLNVYSYPRGLGYNEYPLLGEPAYKKPTARFEDGSFTRAVIVTGGKAMHRYRMSFEQARMEMLRADSLVFAGDWDHAGVWGMEQMLELLMPGCDQPMFDVIILDSGQDQATIRRALNDLRTPADPRYQALKNSARLKRYFDYNFNVNSLAILGNLYRAVTDTNQPVLLTKNMVQILLHAAKTGEISEYGRENSISDWKGTGKYTWQDRGGAEHWLDGIGSAASRHEIVKQMSNLGLLVQKEGSRFAHCHSITQLGSKLASRIHKDCADPDLPFRLHHWMSRPFAEAKVSIDAYLMSFFRKQKRLQDSIRP